MRTLSLLIRRDPQVPAGPVEQGLSYRLVTGTVVVTYGDVPRDST